MSKYTAAVLSLAALAAAQSLSDLSQPCQQGITQLSSNNEANSCLALNQFTNIFLTQANQSVISPVNNWLTAFCGAPACSNSTIKTVVDAITTACATDIAKLGATADQAQMIVPYIQKYFGTAKEVICLANTTSDQFCVTELGNAAEKALGQPLSINNLVSTYSSVLSTQQSPVDKNIVCTPCTQGAIAIVNQNTELNSLFDIGHVASSTCGDNFAASATALPANIVVGTGTAVPKGSSNANNNNGAATLGVAAGVATVAGALIVAFLA